MWSSKEFKSLSNSSQLVECIALTGVILYEAATDYVGSADVYVCWEAGSEDREKWELWNAIFTEDPDWRGQIFKQILQWPNITLTVEPKQEIMLFVANLGEKFLMKKEVHETVR